MRKLPGKNLCFEQLWEPSCQGIQQYSEPASSDAICTRRDQSTWTLTQRHQRGTWWRETADGVTFTTHLTETLSGLRFFHTAFVASSNQVESWTPFSVFWRAVSCRDRKSVCAVSFLEVGPALMSAEQCPHVQPLSARKLQLRPCGAPLTAGSNAARLMF